MRAIIPTTFGQKAIDIIFAIILILAIILVPLFGLSSLVAFALLLLSYVGILSWPPRPSIDMLVTFFALATTGFLAIIWIMASLGIIKLDLGARKIIGRVLIASVLASVAGATAIALKAN